MSYFSSSALASENTNQVHLEANFQSRNVGIFPYLETKRNKKTKNNNKKKSPLSWKRSPGRTLLPESLWPLENRNKLRQDLSEGSEYGLITRRCSARQTEDKYMTGQTPKTVWAELHSWKFGFSVCSSAVDVGGFT